MAEQELKHLNRAALIEIIYQLQKNEMQLHAQIKTLQKALDERRLQIKEAGSIADAAVNISGVMEQAQAAADLYLQNIQALQADILQQKTETEQRCAEMLAASEAQAAQITAEAEEQAKQFLRRAYRSAKKNGWIT